MNTKPEPDKQLTDLLHELRSPLMAIKLAHQQINEMRRKGIESTDSTIDLLNAIITRNLEKIERHFLLIKSIPDNDASKYTRADMSRIVESAIKKSSDRIYLSGIVVENNYIPGHFVSCNVSALTHAFVNIIENAIEAIEPGYGQLWITVYKIENTVKVVFKDNGIGIPPEVISQIFTSNYSSKTHGFGMGLAIVKKILDDHNSQISIISEPSKGTTVVITFPL